MLLQSKLFVQCFQNGEWPKQTRAKNGEWRMANEDDSLLIHAIPFHTVNWINLIFRWDCFLISAEEEYHFYSPMEHHELCIKVTRQVTWKNWSTYHFVKQISNLLTLLPFCLVLRSMPWHAMPCRSTIHAIRIQYYYINVHYTKSVKPFHFYDILVETQIAKMKRNESNQCDTA